MSSWRRARLCFLVIQRPPICTLFPYTTLFRSRPSFITHLERLPVVASPLAHLAGDVHVGEKVHLDLHQAVPLRSEEHTSELQSRVDLVCRLLLEKKNDPPTAVATSGDIRSLTL